MGHFRNDGPKHIKLTDDILYLHAGTDTYMHICLYSKTCPKRPLKKETDYRLMQVKRINLGQKGLQNASEGAFCNLFDLHKATICY